MIRPFVEILFYALMVLLGAYSATLIYVLLRFGKSKVLGFVLSLFYVILIVSLYGAAATNFNQISFSLF